MCVPRLIDYLCRYWGHLFDQDINVLYDLLCVVGQGLGPRYDTVQRFCTSELDCDRQAGETCWIPFSGCSRGTCKCDPRSQFKDQHGKCRNCKYNLSLSDQSSNFDKVNCPLLPVPTHFCQDF